LQRSKQTESAQKCALFSLSTIKQKAKQMSLSQYELMRDRITLRSVNKAEQKERDTARKAERELKRKLVAQVTLETVIDALDYDESEAFEIHESLQRYSAAHAE
jgi:hypothetical protein